MENKYTLEDIKILLKPYEEIIGYVDEFLDDEKVKQLNYIKVAREALEKIAIMKCRHAFQDIHNYIFFYKSPYYEQWNKLLDNKLCVDYEHTHRYLDNVRLTKKMYKKDMRELKSQLKLIGKY